MKNPLFSEFPSVTAKQWKQKIQFDLKGKSYNDTLLTKTNEGIIIKPFYHKDEFKLLEIPNSVANFKICQTIFIFNEKTANYLTKDALNRGADSIKFIAKDKFDIKLLLKDLFLDNKDSLQIIFQLHFLEENFILDLMNHVKSKQFYLQIDLIGNLARTGNWFYNNKQDHKILKNLINKSSKGIGVLGIDASLYQNSGANIVQQLAYALAHANEYLNFLFNLKSSSDLQITSIENIVRKIQFTFAIGGNYFFEIAKLRAFRVLWALLLKKYNLDADAKIFSEPSYRNQTLYDHHVNILRNTTACQSAILGGSDVISNIAHDAIFHKKNEFGERIARNQLLILREESYIINGDFTNGSYYIEELTSEISEKALILFKEIEKSGGFVNQLFKGTIQRKIMESSKKEEDQFDSGELVLLGTNKYTNKEEKMKNEIELYPFVRTKSRETIIQTITPKRIAERLEKKRLNLE